MNRVVNGSHVSLSATLLRKVSKRKGVTVGRRGERSEHKHGYK